MTRPHVGRLDLSGILINKVSFVSVLLVLCRGVPTVAQDEVITERFPVNRDVGLNGVDGEQYTNTGASGFVLPPRFARTAWTLRTVWTLGHFPAPKGAAGSVRSCVERTSWGVRKVSGSVREVMVGAT